MTDMTERVRNKLIGRVYDLHAEYTEAVRKSPLSESSQYDLIYFAELFVRWLDNDYTPGQGL
jgi:hypothetical protein